MKLSPYLAIAAFLFSTISLQAENRPNILWITIEDWSTDLSCYGTKGIHTPHIDQLAKEGILYTNAFTTSPVCSTSRSAMMTGYHQNFIGAEQHREHNRQALPQGILPIPHLMKKAGYFTALMSWKVDCNFLPNKASDLFEGNDWNQRKDNQPFFARITFGDTHRSWKRDPLRPIDTKEIELPPYYPDNEFCRRDWANGLEQAQLVDRQVGELLERLKEEGLEDNTVIFFIADHGRCHIRGKQFLYDPGIRIPMIVRWPDGKRQAEVNNDLMVSLDLCATALDIAGIAPSIPLHGQSLLKEPKSPRKYIYAAREKMDETHDSMRAIRSKDFKLILNLMPERPYLQYNTYKENAYPMLAEMNILHQQGKLTPEQSLFMASSKPEMELYDLNKDPHELNNLANDPDHLDIKTTLLSELTAWRKDVIIDQGVSEEFRANDAFPETLTFDSVEQWVVANENDYDFNKLGWPAWYPTRTLAKWQEARAVWETWVMRDLSATMDRPVISEQLPARKTKKKKKSSR